LVRIVGKTFNLFDALGIKIITRLWDRVEFNRMEDCVCLTKPLCWGSLR
jgi:hypothetical protein